MSTGIQIPTGTRMATLGLRKKARQPIQGAESELRIEVERQAAWPTGVREIQAMESEKRFRHQKNKKQNVSCLE